MQKIKLLTTLFLLATAAACANNIQVANVLLNTQNTVNHTSLIGFDVSWENSWRTSTNENNYDGAWIFVKFRKNGTTDWRHCTIATTGFTNAAGSAFSIPADGKGAFIYRSANGIGNVSYLANKLQWNYGADGILDNETVEIRLFALEMVYIPTGSFLLGSGGTEVNYFRNGSTTNPYLVATAGSIPTGTTAGELNAAVPGPSIPATFPTGFSAFWIMKYECTQQQYADFLNHLDIARATVLNTSGLLTGAHPNFMPSASDRAITGVGYRANAALADWSGLRPYSELEYEKACRGFNTPAVPNEYAWGTTTLSQLAGTTDPNTPNEAVQLPLTANAALGSFGLPTRVGIFARPSGSTRELSGATYYGVMNMSDNVYEITVSSGSVSGQAINASVHGDGYLGNDALTDIAEWRSGPAFGYRGGSYISGVGAGRISDRIAVDFFASYPNDYVSAGAGLRSARTAP